MDQKTSAAAGDRRNFNRHEDLRDLLARFEEIGELEVIEGADWNMEIAALGEVVVLEKVQRFAPLAIGM